MDNQPENTVLHILCIIGLGDFPGGPTESCKRQLQLPKKVVLGQIPSKCSYCLSVLNSNTMAACAKWLIGNIERQRKTTYVYALV